MTYNKKLKILFVSAEVSPFAKTGGLADVAGSLPKALAFKGNDVRVVMPRYKSIKATMNYVTDFPVQMGERKDTCIIRETEVLATGSEGMTKYPVYFVDNYNYYDKEGIYGHFDDGERFLFLCKAVLEMLPRINFQPDIIHCNDWHTGPVCMMIKEQYNRQPFYNGIATVFTIHNLEYQGNFPEDILKFTNLGKEVFTPDKVEFYGMFSFMKAGIVYADIINTVSGVYAREIQTSEYGERLDGLLRKRSEDLYGIVNGISYEEFNPETDKSIIKNYNVDSVDYKKQNKYALQKELGLPVGDMPVVGLISRLSSQKGLDLIIKEIDRIMSLDLQFILLGKGDEYYQNAFREIEKKYKEKFRARLELNFPLAQRIYAGSDMFLMPSRFEPCGLGQLISLRFGTIPIVRATGGLAETITDYDSDNEKGNGFSFNEFSSEQMVNTIERALSLYTGNPEEWSRLVKRAMSHDFSWKSSAEKYMKLYYTALEKVN
ncbi:MAG TPA: glycogen synthase GlgA [Clostridiaceae bacterium]|nr:glycogen synthase GlgA [Clostridiaceae bacterium]